MNSILEFIYVLFFVPSDTFLYFSLLSITVISVYIIVQQSQPVEQIDLEASTSKLATHYAQELPQPASKRHLHVRHMTHLDLQPAISETQPESESNQDKNCQLPPQSSHTSTSIHNAAPPNIHPLQTFGPASQHDSLLETGGLFTNYNQNSSITLPRPQERNHNGDGSTSSLELSD